MNDSISNFFSDINKANMRKEKPEEGVMLHIRARGIAASSHSKLFLSVILSFIMRVFLDFFGLLFALIGNFHLLIIASVVTIGFYYFINVTLTDAFYIFSSIIVLLNSRPVASWVLKFLFDFFDIILYCLLSKFWAKLVLMNPLSYKTGSISSFSVHIFSTRQLWRGLREQKEEDEFFDTYTELLGDDDAIRVLIADYWKSQGV